MSGEAEITELLRLSARLGKNPQLVQASSGNTSIKLDDTLWIKASGKWLANAMDEVMLVPLSISRFRQCLGKSASICNSGAWIEGTYLKPSIETAMHLVLPHRVVIHIHSVNTIAWAVRQDGAECLAERLAGLPWAWVPYVASGLPLARSVEREVAADNNICIFVLANHGLVVCGETCEEADLLLAQVESRLLQALRNGCPSVDPVTKRILEDGILFPCQAIFLGQDFAWKRFCGPANTGAPQLTSSQRIVMGALIQVARRIADTAPMRYLSEPQVTALLNEDAHQYRISTEKNAIPVSHQP